MSDWRSIVINNLKKGAYIFVNEKNTLSKYNVDDA
jgi:hypothetical protein